MRPEPRQVFPNTSVTPNALERTHAWVPLLGTGRLQSAPPWESRTPVPILGTLLVCKPRLDCHRAVAAAPCENVRFEFVVGDPPNFFHLAEQKKLAPDSAAARNHVPFRRNRRHARVVEWQTRTFEGRMPKGVRVQVPSRVPCGTTGRKAAWIEDSRGLCIGDSFEQSAGEGEETDNCPHSRLRTVA